MGLFKNMKTGMDLSLQALAQGGATPTSADRDAVQAQGDEYLRLAQVGLPGNAVLTGASDSDLAPYAPGTSYSVRIDPEDRENVTFG